MQNHKAVMQRDSGGTRQLAAGWRGWQQSIMEREPHSPHAAPQDELRAIHRPLTQGESPLLQPQRPGSRRQSLGSWQLSASEAMVSRPRDPTVPGSRALPQPQVAGGMQQAQHVCRHSQARGGGEETKAKWKPRVDREPILVGKAGGDRDGRAELPPG